jgi:hypothetical protein
MNLEDESVDTRPSEYGVATIAAVLGAYFVYAGLRGLHAYAAGTIASFSDPWICAFGLLAGPWMILVALRLFRGSRRRPYLLNDVELLIYSLVALAGGIWAISLGLLHTRVIALPAVGILGLGYWWRRHRRVKSLPPAA